jgi:NADPH:quinone reductase-like Zn-dependent oxidoreductase/SAM-dependent methyltransferase
VACINSPSSTTVAGDLSAIIELEDLAKAEGVFARRLKIDTAWHSHHMAPIATLYGKALEGMQSEHNVHDSGALSSVAFSSPVTGGRMTSAKAIARPKHWVESLVKPVQFVAAFTDMVLNDLKSSSPNVDVIVEVGPHTALGGPIQEILALPELKEMSIRYYGCLVRNTNARDSMQALAASLVQEGYPVDMKAVNFADDRNHRVKVLPDLPSYPWNHHIRHWVEPRFNKALRERSQPPHDLLGSLVEGSNPTTPSWRHILRISESPWTRDHVIQSNILYPAAGYICLVIEAIKQLTTIDQTTSAQEISGYRLRDVDFLKALMIPDNSDGVEIQTTIRPVGEKDISMRGWKHFEIWTVTADNRWTQHAKGLVTVEFENPEGFKPAERIQNIEGDIKRVIPADLFGNLRALGIAHGPRFQNMKNIVQSGTDQRSLVTMAVADISVPNDLPRDHVMNPVTLDSVITAPYSAIKGAAAHESAAKVPRSVESFWVSSKISHVAGNLLKAHSQLVRHDDQILEAEVSVSNEDDGDVVLKMKRFTYQSLGHNNPVQTPSWKKELCSKIEWSLDISLRSPATISSIQKQLGMKTDTTQDNLPRDISRACIHFIEKSLDTLGPDAVNKINPDLLKHHAWMKHALQKVAPAKPRLDSFDRPFDINRVATSSEYGEIICRVGNQLNEVLLGKVTLLDLMTQDNLLSRFYKESPSVKRAGSQLAGLLRHLVHKNPRMSILEVGAGAGAMTGYALEVLGTNRSGGPHASSYHYTDISTALIEMARAKFLPWKELISFSVLDIESDPATEGFANGTYDVVIASCVLYNTNSISHTLGNVRKLLKPGGTLLLTEELQHSIEVQFVNGLLPGWYSGKDCGEKASGKAVLSTAVLDRDLRNAGFTGIDLHLHDLEKADISTSITVMSTLPEPISPKLLVDPDEVVIITNRKTSSPPLEWIEGLQKSISAHTYSDKREGKVPTVQDLESASATAAWYEDKICIFVGEMDEPILYNLCSTALEGIRAMSTNCKGLIWVTRGGAVNCERPEVSLASGFVRALRTEYVGRKLITLDLDPKGLFWSEVGVTSIVQILRSSFGDSEHGGGGATGPREFEYAEREGIILVPRFYHDVARDQTISSNLDQIHTQDNATTAPLYQADRPLCLIPGSSAFTDDVYVNSFGDCLAPDLVEIEPKAYGANLHHTDKKFVSFECAGIVTRIGNEALKQGYSVGDRVFCIMRRSKLSSRVIVEWTSTTRIPAQLSFEAAASMPLCFLTAYYSLLEIARLKCGQSVLIHDAASDVGQAAIMVARHLNAEVFATVGSLEEQDFITHKYSLPVNHIFGSRNASFGVAVLATTKTRGVDVVLNSLRGSLLQESFNLVAPLGTFIEIGGYDVQQNSNLEMLPFTRHVSFSAVDIPTLLEHAGLDVHRCLEGVVGLLEAKAISPIHPLSVYSMADMAEAIDAMKMGRHVGKVVLSVGPNEMVPVLPQKTAAHFPPDSSYLIVGGTGGLGRSVAHWMVSRGAKNLIILSRNALKSEKTAALAKELRERGCSRVLLVSGDVGKEDEVANAIQNRADEGLPPIRGLIHTAFLLRVSKLLRFAIQAARVASN